ncbi:amidohydrolase family protein, partial [Alcanivorax sp. HI0083]|uniref:amidohydrolase family protein n=1 Tax=Alcanivorax sp. HI0083 TaxID=1822258 RepID=UPI000B2E8368
LSLVLELVSEGKLSLSRALDAVTAAPARCLGIQAGRLETGRPASLCVLDPAADKNLSEDWLSAGNNSPWRHAQLKGSVKLTVCQGKVSWLSD